MAAPEGPGRADAGGAREPRSGASESRTAGNHDLTHGVRYCSDNFGILVSLKTTQNIFIFIPGVGYGVACCFRPSAAADCGPPRALAEAWPCQLQMVSAVVCCLDSVGFSEGREMLETW